MLIAAAVILVSITVAVLIAEGMVRLVAPQQLILIRPDLWQPADTIGWLHRPNADVKINTGDRTVSVITDRDGYRVGSAGRREASGQVLLIGDSFIEALALEHEHTVAHLLEGALSTSVGRTIAVRNTGVGGWDPNHYLIRARSLLARDTFDLVIAAVFVGNDVIDSVTNHVRPRAPLYRFEFRMPRSLQAREIVQSWLMPINDALEVRSHLLVLLKTQLKTLRMRMGLTAYYFPDEFRRDVAGSPRWDVTTSALQELARLSASHGTPTLFVLLPISFQVYPQLFDDYLRAFHIDSAAVDIDQPTRILYQKLSTAGLNVVDALPALRAAADSRRLYGAVDDHLSADGHRVLADAIAPVAARLIQSRKPRRPPAR
jgi:hypothetical protein